MIFIRRISGSSMSPTIRHGDVIIGKRDSVAQGDVVLARHDGREIIKRVTRIVDERYFLEGDNPSASTDSRQFGFVDKSAILGVMKLHFATATPAPTVKRKQTIYASWILSAIFIFFALVHLFRIDTFVPLLDQIFPGGKTTAAIIAVGIVTMEVFALPFLMRMKLSPLARFFSAVFSILVPLLWLLVSIWTYGSVLSTAQLGEFKVLNSNWFLILMNAVWLVYAYALSTVLMPSWSKELRKH